MGKESVNKIEDRVLLLFPTGRDSALVSSVLAKAGLSCFVCDSILSLGAEIDKGGGAVLIAEEALNDGVLDRLAEEIERQPIWSDIPVMVFSVNNRTAEALLLTLGGRINATIVERPIRLTMLISAVQAALRARQRQYQTRDLLTQLREADKQKDLFLATLSHELRTPLNSIMGWLQLLRGESREQLDVDHALEVIERNAKAQSEMISDILLVSRAIVGKVELRFDTVDLSSVVASTLDIIRPSAEEKNIAVNFSRAHEIPPIYADRERLKQIILNLLTNAVKFTPDKGEIAISLARQAGDVELRVSDTGRGIPPEFLPHVFERFRQADNSYTRRVGGLGLGLSIASHLVQLHNGSIRAESEGAGCGSTFIVNLPLSQPGANPVPYEREAKHRGNGWSRLRDLPLLLVEDDADSREMLVTALERFGIKVTAVDSADAALETLEQVHPQVIVSDIGLPRVDGYQLMRKIRSLPAEQGGKTPAIALTGYVSTQDRSLAIDSGFQGHLAKPIEVEELLKLISEVTEVRPGH